MRDLGRASEAHGEERVHQVELGRQLENGAGVGALLRPQRLESRTAGLDLGLCVRVAALAKEELKQANAHLQDVLGAGAPLHLCDCHERNLERGLGFPRIEQVLHPLPLEKHEPIKQPGLPIAAEGEVYERKKGL